MNRSSGSFAPLPEPSPVGRKRLLVDERVRDWYHNKATKSRLSAITNVRKLDFLLDQLCLSLDETETMARKRPDELRRRLNRYVTRAKESGRLDSYLGKLFNGLRAYFRFRRIRFDRYPELDTIQGASIANEKVPTQEQLGLVLERLSTRGRVIALLISHSGVRPQVIGAYEGARGLVLQDLPELVYSPDIRFEKIPFIIRGRPELAKRRKAWTTFGTRQLATSIVAYLQERQRRGEILEPGSPLVTHNEVRGAALRSREEFGRKFLTTTHVVLEVAKALHAAAPKDGRLRPYVLRGFFSTALVRAGVDRDLREALLAHDTGVAGIYNVGKPWPDDLLEKARGEYERATEYLETLSRPKASTRAELIGDLIRALNAVTARKTDGKSFTPDDLRRALRDTLRASRDEDSSVAIPAESDFAVRAGVPGEQRVVDVEQVRAFLKKGWSYRSALNSEMAVVQWDTPTPR